MRKALFLFIYMITVCSAFSQKQKADSLASLLNKAVDTSRVNLLNEISKALWYYELDKATAYNDSALSLAGSIAYQRGLAEANRSRGVILSFRNDPAGMTFLVKALELFKQQNDKRGIAATLNNQNVFYLRNNEYSRALEVLNESLQLFTELKDKEAIGAITNQLGNIYNQLSNYSTALEFYLKALNIRKEIHDRPGTAFSLSRVGDMYYKLGKLPEALDYYQQSFEIAKELKRNQNMIDVSISIGKVYLQQKKYNDALTYFEISRKAEDMYFGKDSVATSYQYIGQVYQEQKNYALSLANFQTALKIASGKNAWQTAGILNSIAQVYAAQGNSSKALETCLQSFAIAKQHKMYSMVKDAAFTLSWLYASINDYPNAYRYQLQYNVAKDSLGEESHNQQLAALQQSFEVRNRQNQIDLLSKDKELQQSVIDKQKQQRYALIAGIFLFIVLVIVLARNNRHKQKANLVLEKTLSNLRSTQAQLIQSEKMASLGTLTAGIAHEIQNPLNFVNNFSDVNKELIDELNEAIKKGNLEEVQLIAKDIKVNEEKINLHGKRADSIVKGMLQHSRHTDGKKELTDINKLVDEYVRLAYHGLRAKDKSFNATINTDLDKHIGTVDIVPQDMGRVLLNLINNAFYAVGEKKKQLGDHYEPTISVNTKRTANTIEIIIADNGNGIPEKIADKIFQPFFTTKPTGQGTGLGLSLAYDIVKAHGGEIKVDSKAGERTVFFIHLPITD